MSLPKAHQPCECLNAHSTINRLSERYLSQRGHPGQAQLRLNQIISSPYRQHLRQKKQINQPDSLAVKQLGTTFSQLSWGNSNVDMKIKSTFCTYGIYQRKSH